LVLALKSPRERVPAAVALLAHGWGKPVQMISADPDQPLLVDFQWADASPATHTDARAVGTQIEPQIIEAVVADETDSA
jgi:hypothetical protein